jgi:hypothetical protein
MCTVPGSARAVVQVSGGAACPDFGMPSESLARRLRLPGDDHAAIGQVQRRDARRALFFGRNPRIADKTWFLRNTPPGTDLSRVCLVPQLSGSSSASSGKPSWVILQTDKVVHNRSFAEVAGSQGPAMPAWGSVDGAGNRGEFGLVGAAPGVLADISEADIWPSRLWHVARWLGSRPGEELMLTVWGRKTSSNVQALMWCIGELSLPYERRDAGHRYGGTDTPSFLAMNPNGTVPVLRDGEGEPIWETGAILRYLAGRYGAASFWPNEGCARARVDQWAEWSKINITLGFTVPIFWRVIRTAPADQAR